VPEVEQARAVLFLDEADSLFGKRTNATDAHERYANVESTTSCSGLRDLCARSE
jgi:SpoVK/Ycf46/Vps4 family AAA+-type ATPase